MESIFRYFEKNAELYPLFIPERDAALAVNELIRDADGWSIRLMHEIASHINRVSHTEHYDGAGWTDYRMHLGGLAKTNGFDAHWGTTEAMVFTPLFPIPTEAFFTALEYKIGDALSRSTDIERRRCRCDGILPHSEQQTLEYIPVRAWIDEGRSKGQSHGQFLYDCTVYAGDRARQASADTLADCIPPTDTDEWIELDRQKRTLTVYLL